MNVASLKYRGSRGAAVDNRRLDGMDDEIGRVVADANRLFVQMGPWNEVSVNAQYTAKPFDIVLCDPSGGAFSVLLPDPSTVTGQWVIIKNDSASANAITLVDVSGGAVDGSTAVINTARGRLCLCALSVGWRVLL